MVNDAGDERTVHDMAFRDSHEPLGGEFWQRTGTFRAWQVTEALVLRTMEGRAVAEPGDWWWRAWRALAGHRQPVPAHVHERHRGFLTRRSSTLK